MRGVSGRSAGQRLVEPVPWQLEPTLELSGQIDPRLTGALSLTPRLLLLQGGDGDFAVDDAATYLAGAASLAWRADERSSLTLQAAGARGTLAMSPLTQLTGASAAVSAGSAAPPGGTALDPAAGLRTGRFASASGRAALDWRATPTFTLSGALSGSHAGGLGEAGALLFPAVDTRSAEGRGALILTARDGLELQATFTRTWLAAQGRVGLLDALGRWSRKVATGVDASLGGGLAVTLERGLSGAAATSPLAGRVTPRLEGALTLQAPPAGAGVGLVALLGYAPFVDPFAREVRSRITGALQVEGRLDAHRRLTGALLGASAVGGSGAGQGVAAAEAGGWYRWTTLEVGLTGRGGLQEASGATGPVWQWSAGLACRWREGLTPG